MRVNELPLSPSRSVFTIGMPPATDASKLSAARCRSASAASLWPWAASSALLAVTTGLPAASAVSTAPLAGSPAPPITSTRTSMPGSPASSTGSAAQRTFFRSTARFLPRERALTATTSIGRPQRATSLSRSCPRSWITAVPTVPSPARPTFNGSAINVANLERRQNASPMRDGGAGRLTSRRQGYDVVQHFRPCFKKAPDVAGGLADTLFVLDQGDAYMAFAVLAEAGAGRYGDARLLDQQGGKLDAAHAAERLRDRRPREHRSAWRRHLPAGAAERFDQRIAAALVDGAHLVNA